MRWLGPDDLRLALPMEAAIEAMIGAFGPDREVPVRTHLGGSLFMPGRVGTRTGIKVISTVPGNPVGVVAAFDAGGSPLGLVDGPTLTKIRTGAASGLATRLLARPDAGALAMLGAGAMAPEQIEAVRTVRPIKRVVVWSRSRDRAEKLARVVGGEVETEAATAVAAADVVCCATPSRRPLFPDGAVRPGTHINAVGAFTPDMVELPAATLHRAFVVVDDHEAAAEEAGDLIQAGRLPADATLTDLLAGRQIPDAEVTVFKSVGIASQDVAAAAAALSAAARQDLGTAL